MAGHSNKQNSKMPVFQIICVDEMRGGEASFDARGRAPERDDGDCDGRQEAGGSERDDAFLATTYYKVARRDLTEESN